MNKIIIETLKQEIESTENYLHQLKLKATFTPEDLDSIASTGRVLYGFKQQLVLLQGN